MNVGRGMSMWGCLVKCCMVVDVGCVCCAVVSVGGSVVSQV